jgi:L-threonylcarbamoyladenylate synthase
VVADLGDAVSVVLDAGPTRIGLESTIVDLTGALPRLLRAGAVPRLELERVLGRPLAAVASAGDGPAAPGMLASHYAPSARLRLDAAAVEPGEALLAFGPGLPANAAAAVATINLSPGGDLAEAAARFFSALRELDRRAPVIAVAPIPDTGLGEAINDRLRRAAAPR